MKRNIVVLLIVTINLICLYRIISLNQNNAYTINNSVFEGLTAPRGRILDVKGNILVDNIGVKSLVFNKLNIKNSEVITISEKLAEIIDINENLTDYDKRYYYYLNNKNEIDKLISSDSLKRYEERKISSKDILEEKLSLISEEKLSKVNSKAAYIYKLLTDGYSYEDKIIKKDLTKEEYNKVNSMDLKGIRTEITWERYYPYKSLLRDVLGVVSSYKQGIPYELKNYYLKKGYKLNDRVGVTNLEYIYDDYLKGTKAKYEVKDNKITKIKDEEKGKDLVLSIDINMQMDIEKIMEEEMLTAKKEYNTKYYNTSYMVVSNPVTGEVISLIGKNLNDDQTFNDYSYYNVINSFTIGSAVKGASISVGYNNHIIDENTKVKDGCVYLKNQGGKCSWKTLGVMNDIEALRMSSNYFQYLIAVGLTGHKYKAGLTLNANKSHFDIYRDTFASYGLGTKTNIDLINESTGQKGTTYSDDLLLNMSIGQYDTYTPISLSQYINTIATGKRKELSLLRYILNNDGSIYYEKQNKVLNKPLIEDKYLDRIRKGLYEVNKSGTGYSYTTHKFTSAGKTGTAESFMDTDLDGKIDKQTVSTSYIMYAPFEDPKFSIIIVSPNIKYKNNVSNYKYPINAKIMRRVSTLVYDNYA